MSASSRILGIDYGTKRIGVAMADLETRIATPLTMLEGSGDVTKDAAMVNDLAVREDSQVFVVGLPLNMDGSEGAQAALTRKFAAALERLSKQPVHHQDERLSSFAAEQVLDSTGFGAKKRKALSDQIAAQKILQAYLDRCG